MHAHPRRASPITREVICLSSSITTVAGTMLPRPNLPTVSRSAPEEWFDLASALIVVDGHGDKLDIFTRVRLCKLREAWELVLAWLTPCSPEVENHDFSAQAGKLLRLAGKVLKGKLWGSFGERAD